MVYYPDLDENFGISYPYLPLLDNRPEHRVLGDL